MADSVQAIREVPQPPEKLGRTPRQLRNYFINLRYQLKFTLTIVGISSLIMGSLGFVVMSKAHEASRIIEVRAFDDDDLIARQLMEQFARNDRVLTVALCACGVLLTLVLFAYGIVLTHKVAGPLFKVSTYLDRIREGRLGVVYDLRKGDELVDFFERFKAAHDALRARTADDIRLLDQTISALAIDVDRMALVSELKRVREEKARSLK
jgi:hypothetical protein